MFRRVRCARTTGSCQSHTTASPQTAALFAARQRRLMAEPNYRELLAEGLEKARSRTVAGRKMPAEQADKMRQGEVQTCPVCGQEFYAAPSTRGKYCSHRCYATTVPARWRDPEFMERITAASHAAKAAQRRQRVCTVCGRQFWNHHRTTCSDECRAEARRRHASTVLQRWREEHPQEVREHGRASIARAHAARRGTHAAQVDGVCPTCGRSFRRFKEHGRPPKYCSASCYQAARRGAVRDV